MLISPRGLLRDDGQPFSDTARSALPSVAAPSWFAPPIDVRGDGDSLTILFSVPREATEVRAESTGSSVVLRARLPAGGGGETQRGVRVFALPFEVPRGPAKIVRRSGVVEVRLRRFHPDARKLPCNVEATECAPVTQ